MALLTEIVVVPKGKRTPLLLEVPISQGLDGPFLVSSSKAFLWVNKFVTNVVRVAVRKIPPEFMFRGMIEEVEKKSLELGWGNVVPPTKDGMSLAIAHLTEYELTPVEILWGTGFNEDLLPEKVLAMETTWVPEGYAIVVPQDRGYLGTSFDFGKGQWAGVLHNASRGIAIITPDVT